MEKGSVCACADLVDNIGFKIAVDGTRNIFAISYGRMLELDKQLRWMFFTSLGEEGGKALVVVAGLALLSEVTVRLCCC